MMILPVSSSLNLTAILHQSPWNGLLLACMIEEFADSSIYPFFISETFVPLALIFTVLCDLFQGKGLGQGCVLAGESSEYKLRG